MTVVLTEPVDEQQYAAAWKEVPQEKRDRVVAHLRANLDPAALRHVRAGGEVDHFFGGMAIRNLIRGVMRDEELPGVYYAWASTDEPIRNWDDYYVQALRDAAGCPRNETSPPPPPPKPARPTREPGYVPPGRIARFFRRLLG